MIVAITGETGFLGKHLSSFFLHVLKYKVISLGRNYLSSIERMKEADYLIHAASVHRNPDPEIVYRENMKINYDLISALYENDIKINIVFISSIHETLDTPYGRSKLEGRELFRKYCGNVGRIFISHALPNLFGPGAKPNNTSFVATFSYNLHNNIQCVYNDNKVNLCYVDDAVTKIGKFSAERSFFKTVYISVSEVFHLLSYFKAVLDTGNIPETKSGFEKNLLNTFITYK